MPVSARRIGLQRIPEMVALVDVATKNGCPAIGYGIYGFCLFRAEIILLLKTYPMFTEDVPQLYLASLVFHISPFI